ALLLTVAIKHLAIPLLGADRARGLGVRLAVEPGATLDGGAGALAVAAGGALIAAVARARAAGPIWLLAAAGAIAALSYAGALHDHGALVTVDYGTRYAYAPGVLAALALIGV